MSRTLTLTALAVTALFVAPAAGAEWMSYGTFEPDTNYDNPSLMWADAPGSIKDRVYFNAYSKWGDPGADGSYYNPNVGAAHTRFDVAGPTSWQAFLGVWTDCNGDGYIGIAETAAREYSSVLLLDTTLCPPLTASTGSWPAGRNNYNGWVTELIPIGNKETRPQDARVYKDDEAMVWGDTGRPDADWPQAEPTCPNFPLPGDSHTTGGIVRTADCRGNRGVVAAFNDADATLGAGLGFGDPENAQDSTSPLNVDTFGDDGSEHAAVRLQDCSAEPIVGTGTDTFPGSDQDNIPILRPVPSDPVNGDMNSWTVAGQVNETNEEITVVPSNETDDSGPDETANCDTSDDRGNDVYGVFERNVAINAEDGKRNAQWNFVFQTASRGTLPANAVSAGRAGAPTDFGFELLNAECGASNCVQSMYVGGNTLTYTPPVFRGSLQDGSLDGDETTIADAPYWSFYAHVGAATTTTRAFKVPGGTGVYGSAQCGSFTSGERHGWNCAESDWYLLADGTRSTDTSPRPLAKVGQLYNLRDIDCMDGSNDAGVPLSPSGLGNNPC